MSRFLGVVVLAGLALLASASVASAQGTAANKPNFGPYYRPQLTPYLNLARGGSPGINYFLGTLPEIQTRRNFGVLDNSLQELELKTANAAREENVVDPISKTMTSVYGNTLGVYGNTGTFYGTNGPRFGVVTPPKIGEPVTRRR